MLHNINSKIKSTLNQLVSMEESRIHLLYMCSLSSGHIFFNIIVWLSNDDQFGSIAKTIFSFTMPPPHAGARFYTGITLFHPLICHHLVLSIGSKGFSSNLVQMFTSSRSFVDPLCQVKVTFEGQGHWLEYELHFQWLFWFVLCFKTLVFVLSLKWDCTI